MYLLDTSFIEMVNINGDETLYITQISFQDYCALVLALSSDDQQSIYNTETKYYMKIYWIKEFLD